MIDVTSYSITLPVSLFGFVVVRLLHSFRLASKSQSVRKPGTLEVSLTVSFVILFLSISLIAFPSYASASRTWEGAAAFVILGSTLSLLLPALLVLALFGGGFASARLTNKGCRFSVLVGAVNSISAITPALFFAPVLLERLFSANLLYVFSIFFGAFCEELFYRGLIQTRMEGLFGLTKGLLITATIFDLVHAPAWIFINGLTFTNVVIDMVLSFPFGLLLGYMAQKSNNVLGSTIYHAVFNLPLFLL